MTAPIFTLPAPGAEAAERAAHPIPAGVYYLAETGNFYSAADGIGLGMAFWTRWRARSGEFPTSAAAALRPAVGAADGLAEASDAAANRAREALSDALDAMLAAFVDEVSAVTDPCERLAVDAALDALALDRAVASANAVARLSAPAGAAPGAGYQPSPYASGYPSPMNCDLDVLAPSPAAARGPEGVRVRAELVALSAAATPGPWTTRLHGLSRPDFAEIDGQGWSELASVTVQMEDESFRSVEGLANLKLIAAAVNRLREEISDAARPSRAEGEVQP